MTDIKWAEKVIDMIGREFYIGRVTYGRRTEKIEVDNKEYVRHVHEQVPVAIRVKVTAVRFTNYGDGLKARVDCHDITKSQWDGGYQMQWHELREDEESAMHDAEKEIRKFAEAMTVKTYEKVVEHFES